MASTFFRDLPTLHFHVIPELRKNRYINVWDTGCVMGPEPYSLAIIFKKTLRYYEFKMLKIYATDPPITGCFRWFLRNFSKSLGKSAVYQPYGFPPSRE